MVVHPQDSRRDVADNTVHERRPKFVDASAFTIVSSQEQGLVKAQVSRRQAGTYLLRSSQRVKHIIDGDIPDRHRLPVRTGKSAKLADVAGVRRQTYPPQL